MGDTQTRAGATRPRAPRPVKTAVLENQMETFAAERVKCFALLIECAMLLTAYSNLNARSGFPFKDPPRARALIQEIDALTDE